MAEFNRNSRRYLRKRKFKRTVRRKLSLNDIHILDFLWMWKVASSQMLKLVGYKRKSEWWAYKAIRQLEKEKYIQRLPRGKYLDLEVWALTELGFEIVLMDRDDIVEYRYKPHAPSHDYFATCLQLGELWISGTEKTFFTEQMVSSLRANNFPEHVSGQSHVPDGLTQVKNGKDAVLIGYEVDLNLKDKSRYLETYRYYCKIERVAAVIWLVRNEWIANQIIATFESDYNYRQRGNFFSFVLLDDFKNRLYEAEVFTGKFKGESIRKIHANTLQKLGKTEAILEQKSLKDIFFRKYKSPQKSTLYKKGAFNEKR